MQSIWDSTLSAYWSVTEVRANLAMFLTLAGALLLGLAVGYERTFHGRAIGMRTYGLVCMSSAALTTFVGYPALWYGGLHAGAVASVDPTRVVQGIVTGVGFLGAGVIMKDGLNIRGLTTAASIWSASVIGVLVGVGFYGAAILLAALSILCMLWVHRLELWLPAHQALSVVVQFKPGVAAHEHEFREEVRRYGYEMVEGSLAIHAQRGAAEWHFVATAFDKRKRTSMTELARVMGENDLVDSFQLSHYRN
jgi:putative Mg2+ transporter-C (MgtC) family protein